MFAFLNQFKAVLAMKLVIPQGYSLLLNKSKLFY